MEIRGKIKKGNGFSNLILQVLNSGFEKIQLRVVDGTIIIKSDEIDKLEELKRMTTSTVNWKKRWRENWKKIS